MGRIWAHNNQSESVMSDVESRRRAEPFGLLTREFPTEPTAFHQAEFRRRPLRSHQIQFFGPNDTSLLVRRQELNGAPPLFRPFHEDRKVECLGHRFLRRRIRVNMIAGI